MKQMQFHVRIGRESGWFARVAGVLLALVIVSGIVLLIFGLWLAFAVILALALVAAALRALFGRRPRLGRTDRVIELPPRD
jgi:hypothetical protein